MKRRKLLLALSAILAPASRVSQADDRERVARIGYVDPESRANALWGWPAFWKRLSELGWREGRNLIIEARFAEGEADRLPQLLRDVVERKPDVIFTYTTSGAIAAKEATKTIPVVFAGVIDPVGSGVVASLSRPGGNLTGLSGTWSEGAASKLLEVLEETIPRLSTVAVVSSPESKSYGFVADQLRAAAARRSIKLQFLPVSKATELDDALREARQTSQAVLVAPDPLTYSHRREILALAAKYRLPDAYALTENVEMGGLLAYGADSVAMWRRAAEYVDKILRGSKPADLPVELASRYRLAVNLRTAKTLGIRVPDAVLIRTDEVIK